MPNRLSRALRQLGVRSLRPGQREVIDAVLAGRDTLAVMPTGSGKSLCYQVPALCLDGPTIVLSPLISLMKDQADKVPGEASMPQRSTARCRRARRRRRSRPDGVTRHFLSEYVRPVR